MPPLEDEEEKEKIKNKKNEEKEKKKIDDLISGKASGEKPGMNEMVRIGKGSSSG